MYLIFLLWLNFLVANPPIFIWKMELRNRKLKWNRSYVITLVLFSVEFEKDWTTSSFLQVIILTEWYIPAMICRLNPTRVADWVTKTVAVQLGCRSWNTLSHRWSRRWQQKELKPSPIQWYTGTWCFSFFKTTPTPCNHCTLKWNQLRGLKCQYGDKMQTYATINTLWKTLC